MPDLVDQLVSGQVDLVRQYRDGTLCVDSPRSPALLCGSFNPLHEGHRQLAAVASSFLGQPISFELAIINADKPALPADEVRRRLTQFVELGDVWLTREPTFLGKSRLFGGSTFVIGMDTAERLIDPKYYGGDDGLRSALATIAADGCRFLVAGRIRPDGEFRSLGQLQLPSEYQGLFTELNEDAFRADVSSTDLRARGL